jgi:beta-glucosidase
MHDAMKKYCFLIICLFAATFVEAQHTYKYGPVGNNKSLFISNLMKKMTIEEKVGQLNLVLSGGDPDGNAKEQAGVIRASKGGAVFNVAGAALARKYQKIAVEGTRLGIPLLFGFDCIHGMKTEFPIPLGEAASWDLKTIEKSTRIAACEASALGVNWVYSPMLDICRDARWGRIAEGAGEDPYLGAQVAKARVIGFQGKSLKDNNTVAVCIKHYIAYGAAEAGRDYNTTDMSERTLREIYLPPFKAAVEAGAETVMSSFNAYNGVASAANPFLLRKILKGELGLKGFVVADYDAVRELIDHGLAKDSVEAARIAIEGGLDMDMVSNIFRDKLLPLVKRKVVSEKLIDDAVRRILSVKYDLGLFNDPYLYCDENREKTELMSPDKLQAARESAQRSIVLLKNSQQILPLSKSNKTIAVIGEVANSKSDMNGCWCCYSSGNNPVSILDGIKAAAPNSQILYEKGCKVDANAPEDYSAALDIANKSDVIIMTMGEYAWMSGEAQSRSDIGMPGNQLDLFKKLEALGKPIIVLLTNGRPLAIPYLAEHATAIVETWFLGTEAGNAIADVLFGDYNPSGKLPVSFPYSVGQLPLYYNQLPTGRPHSENLSDPFRSMYKDVSNDALYPFGFGLSYTTFQYSNLRVTNPKMKANDKLEVKVDVKNTGNRAGEEVVQLYIRDLYASVSQPMKSLKKFEKLSILPGQTKTVTFYLSREDLKFYKESAGWITEPGKFYIFVGGNSRDLLKTEFDLL